MSGLGLAGIISGFGNGMGRGLEQMQAGIIQQGLQTSDREWQTRKMQEQREWDAKARGEERSYQSRRDQQQMGANIALHTADNVARAGETTKTIDANKALQGDKIEYEKGDKALERGLKRDELNQKDRLESRQLDITEKYYEGRVGALMQKAQKGAMTKEDWSGVKEYNSILKEKLQGLNKRMEDLTNPEKTILNPDPKDVKRKQDAIQKQIDDVMEQSRTISKIQGVNPVSSSTVPRVLIDPDDDGAEGGQ